MNWYAVAAIGAAVTLAAIAVFGQLVQRRYGSTDVREDHR